MMMLIIVFARKKD